MPETSHIIHRQTVHTHVLGNPTQAAEMQHQVAELLQSSHYLKALDSVLNEFGRVREWLILDEIELNIGQLGIADFEKQFIPKLTTALREKLYDAIPDAVLQGKIVVKSAQKIDYEAFLEFLEYGVFKYYVPDKWENVVGFEEWMKAIVAVLTEQQIAGLKTLFKNNRTARQRLFYQLSEYIGLLILKKILPDTPLTISTLKKLKILFFQIDTPFSLIPVDFIFFKIIDNDTGALKRFEDFVHSTAISKANKALQRQEILEFIRMELPAFGSEPFGQNRDDFEPEKKIQQPSISTEKEAIFIQNAGIVLLNPFLKACFDACGWLKKGGFKNNKSQQKALLMLHFLATGQAQAVEYDLFLPKILCGMAENKPLMREIHLTKKEKAEGESLLKAAIEHWQVLKNTSPDGLREAFLEREGKLERNPFGGWTLTVEQKAQDILLSQLPYGWGVSMVKLEWMKEVLQVDWA